MKQWIKSAVQHVAARAAPQVWRLRRPTLLVLMYHRVLPESHPARATEQPGMFVSPATLDMHLSVLKEKFTLLHLDDWLSAVAADRPVPARACAITFDDGWRDNHDYAFPILERHGVPATVYLVSDLIGTRYTFWPNTLSNLLSGDASAVVQRLPPWLQQLARTHGIGGGGSHGMAHIDALISACKASRSDAAMLAALEDAATPVQGERDLMDWDEIRRWHVKGLVRFGSHTRRHSRLTKIESGELLRDEIVGSRAVIAERLDTVPATFCYPNGDFSPTVVDVVRRNFQGAVTTVRGWNRPSSDAWLLNRVGVHEDVSATPVTFLARLAGIG